MVAKGGQLLQASALDALKALIHKADVLTPNIPEAVFGWNKPTSVDDMNEQMNAY